MKRNIVEKKGSLLTKSKDNKLQTIQAAPPTPGGKSRGIKSRSHSSGLGGDETQKTGRLALIKARHEAIKREIDQIREDLESEEDD